MKFRNSILFSNTDKQIGDYWTLNFLIKYSFVLFLSASIISCSNCLEYQARRLKIRFRDKTNEQTQYLHTLNSTLVATSRTLVAIMENFQTKDGHVEVPQVLQKYLGKNII